jgi:hypothetical protein
MSLDRREQPERNWREPAEWARANVRVNRLPYTSFLSTEQPDGLRRSQFATDQAIRYFLGFFSSGALAA